jgi:hypothetical protein
MIRAMPAPLDPAALPDNVIALRGLLLQREAEHAAELAAACEGLKAQVLRNEQLKLRLARLLRERFGPSSEKLRGALEQLELLLGDLEEQIARQRRRWQNRRQHRQLARPGAASPRVGRCPRHCRARLWSIPRPAPARSVAERCARSART